VSDLDEVRITVNGRAYFSCLDPMATGVPGEEGWPEAELRRVGRGYQAVYLCTVVQAKEIAEWLADFGGTLLQLTAEEDELREGPACMKAAESIWAQLAKAGKT
jgi:hypothetical protein